MRWSPLTVVAAPNGELTLPDVRAYIGIKSDNQGHDPLLNRIRRAVVADAEYYLRRAVFAQRRQFTAFGEVDGEAERRFFNLEPLTGPTASLNGEDVSVTMMGASVLSLDTAWMPMRGDTLTLTYDAGYQLGALPADLHSALLAECQRRYEREVVPAGTGDTQGPLKLIDTGSLLRYRAYTEPLNVDHVEGWGQA